MEERMRRSIALDRALRAGDLTAVRAALEAPSEYPNAVDGSSGGTVLQLALFNGPVATVSALLDDGADPNFEALDGFPALLHRDDAERAELVARLLDAGADPAARTRIDDLTTSADEADAAGHAELARMLREAEAG